MSEVEVTEEARQAVLMELLRDSTPKWRGVAASQGIGLSMEERLELARDSTRYCRRWLVDHGVVPPIQQMELLCLNGADVLRDLESRATEKGAARIAAILAGGARILEGTRQRSTTAPFR